eukprot:scaffold108918_cov36-Prasinocladus_malaysianus.AAC.1
MSRCAVRCGISRSFRRSNETVFGPAGLATPKHLNSVDKSAEDRTTGRHTPRHAAASLRATVRVHPRHGTSDAAIQQKIPKNYRDQILMKRGDHLDASLEEMSSTLDGIILPKTSRYEYG